MTDFVICNNAIIDFNSHESKRCEELFKTFGFNDFENSIQITNIYTDPTDGWPDDEMLVSADVSSGKGVKSVEVDMSFEGGVDALEMGLVSEDKFDGKRQVVWDVHDILEKNYTIIRAGMN